MLNSGDNGRYGDDDVESFLYVCMIIVLVSTIGYVNYAHCLWLVQVSVGATSSRIRGFLLGPRHLVHNVVLSRHRGFT